jgi:hypothetical protein
MPNLSIGPFNRTITADDLSAFFARNGVSVSSLELSWTGCNQTATAEAADPAAVIAACNGKELVFRQLVVVREI